MKKIRLKWVKNRGLDHIIETQTSIRAACHLIEALALSPADRPVPIRALSPLRRPLALTVPVLRFLRRYPTLFAESSHPRYPSLVTFSNTPASSLLLSRLTATAGDVDAHLRLARLLLMSRSRSVPIIAVRSIRHDLGLPHDFMRRYDETFPGMFRRVKERLVLGQSPEQEATPLSTLQRAKGSGEISRGDLRLPCSSLNAPLAFPMRFPRGYGSMKKVRAWMEEFHRLPYISPYEDASGVDPESDVYEKRCVGVLHELLSLTVHKLVRRNFIRPLREEMGLPHKFTRLFTRYPGVFYFSLKCKTATVVLREGYQSGKLVDNNAIAALRGKVHYVMRTGLLYRGKGLSKLVLDEDGDSGCRNDADNGCEFEDVEDYGMEITDSESGDSEDEYDGEDDEDEDD